MKHYALDHLLAQEDGALQAILLFILIQLTKYEASIYKFFFNISTEPLRATCFCVLKSHQHLRPYGDGVKAYILSNRMEKQGIKPVKVRNGAKIRNQYNQEPHLTQDTNNLLNETFIDSCPLNCLACVNPGLQDERTAVCMHLSRVISHINV